MPRPIARRDRGSVHRAPSAVATRRHRRRRARTTTRLAREGHANFSGFFWLLSSFSPPERKKKTWGLGSEATNDFDATEPRAPARSRPARRLRRRLPRVMMPLHATHLADSLRHNLEAAASRARGGLPPRSRQGQRPAFSCTHERFGRPQLGRRVDTRGGGRDGRRASARDRGARRRHRTRRVSRGAGNRSHRQSVQPCRRKQ